MRNDWIHEGPDTSVGIFGEAWYHDEVECLVTPAGEVHLPHGETDFYLLLTCHDCVAQRIVVTRDFTGWDEPDDYAFDAFWDQPRETLYTCDQL